MEEKPVQRAARPDRAGAAHSDDLPVAVLVSRAKEGDKAAWDKLVDRYAPLIWSICSRYRLSPADAEDVIITVWLRLLHELDKIRDPAALPGWLATTTRRECLRVQRAVQGPHAPDSAPDALSLSDEPAGAAERELLVERHAALREAISDLPPASQQLIALLIADPPVPYAEISARLGIPIGSIGPTRSRYLDRLRRHPAIAALLSAIPEVLRVTRR